jgi:hypothetical protein
MSLGWFKWLEITPKVEFAAVVSAVLGGEN